MKFSTLGATIATATAITLGSLATPASALVATPTTGDWGWPACTLELNKEEVNFYQDSLRLAQDTLTAEFKQIIPAATADIDLLRTFLDEVDTDNNIVFLVDSDAANEAVDEADRAQFNAITGRIVAAGQDAGLEVYDEGMGEPVNEALSVIGMLTYFSSFESFDGFFTRADVTTEGATVELGAPHFSNGISLISASIASVEGLSASPVETAIVKSFQTLLPLEAAMTPALQSCVDGVGGTFTPDLPGINPGQDEDGVTTPPAARAGGSSFGSS